MISQIFSLLARPDSWQDTCKTNAASTRTGWTLLVSLERREIGCPLCYVQQNLRQMFASLQLFLTQPLSHDTQRY